MVPEGWKKKNFGDFATLQRGFDLPVEKRKPGKVPIFASNGIVGFHDEVRVSAPGVVTGRSGTIGKVTFVKEDFWALNTTLYIKNFHGNDPEFVYRFIEYFKLERFATGTGVPTLNRNIVHEKEIVVPPIAEQKKIAEILGSVDEAIAATQAVIDQTRKVKQGLLQQLLTRGIEHTKFKETEIGLIPESWNVKRLVDIVASDRPITYGIVQAGPHTPNGVPYIRVSDMVSSSLSPEGMLRTSFAIAEKYKRSAVYSGDIVYALRGKIGHVLSVPKSLDGANLTQGTARISPGSEVEPNYLLWSLRSQVATDQAELVSKGSTFKEISLAALKEIRIPVPTKQEQFKIASFMGEIEKYICDCTESLRVLGITKNGLMQDLLTGRVRVNG